MENICKQHILRKYWNKIVDDPKTIELNVDEAIVMNLSWNNSLMYSNEECRFRIRVANNLGGFKVRSAGIYASIRRLKLRKSDAGQCYDYVTIKHSNDQQTNHICGSFDASPANVDKMPFFADDNGVLIVKISLDKFIPIKSGEDNLEVSIVFTAYKGQCLEANTRILIRKLRTHSTVFGFLSRLRDGSIPSDNVCARPLYIEAVGKRWHR